MVSETRVESTINSPAQYPSRFCSRRRKFCDRAIASSTESWWLNPNSVAIGPARRSRWDPVTRTAHNVLSELETVKELLDAAPAAGASHFLDRRVGDPNHVFTQISLTPCFSGV